METLSNDQDMITLQNQLSTTESPDEASNKLSHYTIAVLVIICLHAITMLLVFEPASDGRDSHGYTVQAKMVADHGRVWYPLESPLQFFGHQWLKLDDDRMMSRYPPGLPIIWAPIYHFIGEEAVFFFNPILATLTLLGLYLLTRLWTREICAFWAVAVMAVNPVINAWAFMADSHLSVAFLLVWGLYCLALWAKTHSILYAVLGGFMLGLIPTIRYAETIFAPAIAIYMLLHKQNTKKYWLSLSSGIIAASLPLILLLIHNAFVFGSPIITGYTNNDHVELFSFQHFFRKFFPYLFAIHIRGLGWFATLGLVGFFVLCLTKNTRKEGILLAGIAIPTLFLYMAYFFYDNSQRFLMPTFYLFVIAAVWVFHLLFEKQVRGTKITLTVLSVLMIIWGGIHSGITLHHSNNRNGRLAEITETVFETIPEENAVVIAPMEICQHLQFVTDFKLIDSQYIIQSEQAPHYQQMENSPPGLEVEGLEAIFQHSIRAELMQRYQHYSAGIAPLFLRDVTKWAGNDAPLYWLGKKEDILDFIPVNDKPEELATFEFVSVPPPPGPPTRRNNEGDSGNSNSNTPQRLGPPQGGMGGPGGRGRPMPLDPEIYSIVKWTRN